MDMLYNVKGAYEILEKAQHSIRDECEYLHAIVKMPAWESRYDLTYNQSPSSWRFGQTREKDFEELVFTMQGVIEAKDLPPILTEPSIPQSKYQYLQQNVTLTGLGTPTFENSVQALASIFANISRHFPEDRMMPWQASPASIAGGQSIVFSNRYFTRRNEAPGMTSTPFHPKVDPNGILARALSGQLLHTEENNVQYFIRHDEPEGRFKYSLADPQSFRVGDVVEVQFALVVYKLRTEHYILKPMLYSVALIDGQFANDLIKRKSGVMIRPVIGKPIKRKIGYDLDLQTNSSPHKRQKQPDNPQSEQEVGELSPFIEKMRLDP